MVDLIIIIQLINLTAKFMTEFSYSVSYQICAQHFVNTVFKYKT